MTNSTSVKCSTRVIVLIPCQYVSAAQKQQPCTSRGYVEQYSIKRNKQREQAIYLGVAFIAAGLPLRQPITTSTSGILNKARFEYAFSKTIFYCNNTKWRNQKNNVSILHPEVRFTAHISIGARVASSSRCVVTEIILFFFAFQFQY